MKDADCVAILQWALPQLGLHWPGFRKVRRQVCRRISGRIGELGLPALARAALELALRVLGTDVDARLLERARAACYPASSLKALPPAWRSQAFERRGKLFCLRETFRGGVELERQDLVAGLPERQFDLVLCRNLAFTYFGAELARAALERIASRLRYGGALVVGVHERLPQPAAGFEPWPGCRAVFRLKPPA